MNHCVNVLEYGQSTVHEVSGDVAVLNILGSCYAMSVVASVSIDESLYQQCS